MRLLTLLAAAGTGAALAYLFDPQHGPKRRAMVRDKAPKLAKDLQKRADGVVKETRRVLGRPAA